MNVCTPQAPSMIMPSHTEAMDRAMEGGIDDVGLAFVRLGAVSL